jgi:hypothetical protein
LERGDDEGTDLPENLPGERRSFEKSPFSVDPVFHHVVVNAVHVFVSGLFVTVDDEGVLSSKFRSMASSRSIRSSSS